MAQPSAVVIVAPLNAAAPTLGWSVLGLLAAALTVAAVVVLRRTSAAARAAVVVAVLTLGVTAAYSTVANVVVSGINCTQVIGLKYDPDAGRQTLGSECTNPIKIVDIEVLCDDPNEGIGGGAAIADCQIGQTLSLGDECLLPICPDI